MKLSDKLWIIMGPQLYKHSKDVDYFLEKIIADGKILGLTNNDYLVMVEYKGRYYKIWITNRWYADLTMAFKTDEKGFELTKMYGDLRPSRMVKLKFWKWLESNGIYKPKKDEDPGMVNNVRTMFVCA